MKHRNIPIFIPHKGCPFKCIYCNQNSQTGSSPKDIKNIDISAIVDKHLSTFPKSISTIEIAFFGGTFTGLERPLQNELLKKASISLQKDKRIIGIRLSTHPLMVNDSTVKFLKKFPVISVELGFQSLNDDVLSASKRGYTSSKAIESFNLLKDSGFQTGIQLMTGLPKDSEKITYKTAVDTIKLKPASVRIYPAIVFRNTFLETLYLNKK